MEKFQQHTRALPVNPKILGAGLEVGKGALHVLYALASTLEPSWAAAKHGGVVYTLELFLPLEEEILL